MNKIYKLGISLSLIIFTGALTSCSEFTPTGYEEVPSLPTVSNLVASVNNRVIDLTWNLPTDMKEVTGLKLITNADNNTALTLDPTVTSYAIKGQPMAQETLYTIKVVYGDKLSPGVSVKTVVPYEELAPVTNLQATVDGRTVTLSWDLPVNPEITGVRIQHNIEGQEVDATYNYPAGTTECVLKGQPMGVNNEYTVQVMYDTYYASTDSKIVGKVEYIEPKMGYVLLAQSIDALPSVGEQVAATWFSQQENTEFITPDQISSLDADIYTVLWIEIMRFGIDLGAGWQNLPYEISNDETIEALKAYTQAGGSLFLSEQATYLCEPLGIVPAGFNPNMVGNGGFGMGDDIWYINPFLGWAFQDGKDLAGREPYYDHSEHQIFQGLEFSAPGTPYEYQAIPMVGPGMRTDNNNMWDCNRYDKGSFPDVIVNFEDKTGSTVLATWGHVVDHCVAGLVDFAPVPDVHGRCVACGFSAYQWYGDDGNNPYQSNIEGLTMNILKYLQ